MPIVIDYEFILSISFSTYYLLHELFVLFRLIFDYNVFPSFYFFLNTCFFRLYMVWRTILFDLFDYILLNLKLDMG